jgi:hypothetical protein
MRATCPACHFILNFRIECVCVCVCLPVCMLFCNVNEVFVACPAVLYCYCCISVHWTQSFGTFPLPCFVNGNTSAAARSQDHRYITRKTGFYYVSLQQSCKPSHDVPLLCLRRSFCFMRKRQFTVHCRFCCLTPAFCLYLHICFLLGSEFTVTFQGPFVSLGPSIICNSQNEFGL